MSSRMSDGVVGGDNRRAVTLVVKEINSGHANSSHGAQGFDISELP